MFWLDLKLRAAIMLSGLGAAELLRKVDEISRLQVGLWVGEHVGASSMTFFERPLYERGP